MHCGQYQKSIDLSPCLYELIKYVVVLFFSQGLEGAVFGHSVETPLIQARASEDLK